ncbi:proline rich transmembrane protein 1B-like isoform X2 [Ptychodera flava]|uniref:proline rich transmembrane protein 1B-like isoform X2 n=1 Tax=Ptychodera flava TaxID=63121 RepID=UPI003969C9AC
MHGTEPLLEDGPPMKQPPPPYGPLTSDTKTAQESNDVHVHCRYGTEQIGNLPNTWMIPAVLACLFCCWPLGLAAIFRASEGQHAIKTGNLQQAEASSASARNLTIASVICGIVITVATLFFYFVLMGRDFGVPDY